MAAQKLIIPVFLVEIEQIFEYFFQRVCIKLSGPCVPIPKWQFGFFSMENDNFGFCPKLFTISFPFSSGECTKIA